jgi:excisionase family DNA binding protein
METVLEGFLTPRELASKSGWPLKTIRKLIASNELRHLRLKNRFFVPQGALEEFIDRKMVDPVAVGDEDE